MSNLLYYNITSIKNQTEEKEQQHHQYYTEIVHTKIISTTKLFFFFLLSNKKETIQNNLCILQYTVFRPLSSNVVHKFFSRNFLIVQCHTKNSKEHSSKTPQSKHLLLAFRYSHYSKHHSS